MRHVHAHHVEDELAFARAAGQAFADDPKITSYSGEHDIAPGAMLALRWGLGDDCVLVLRLSEAHEPTIYAQIVPRMSTATFKEG